MNPLEYKIDERWDDFLSFIEERMSIWYKKEVLKLPAPWTDDQILASGKFGNIFRRLDRGTIWELGELSSYPNTEQGRIQQVELIVTYRHNLIPATTTTLINRLGITALMGSYRPIISDVIKIYPLLHTDKPTQLDWCEYVLKHYMDVTRCVSTIVDLIENRTPMDVMHKTLQLYCPRLGSFKAYEVVTSLTYLSWTRYGENGFPHVGHGAISMLQKLTNDYDTDKDFMCLYLYPLSIQITEQLEERGEIVWPDCTYTTQPFMTVRSVEDALCEYRKYCAVKDGTRENRPYPDNLRRWN